MLISISIGFGKQYSIEVLNVRILHRKYEMTMSIIPPVTLQLLRVQSHMSTKGNRGNQSERKLEAEAKLY
jgi:hypothetical protein